MKSFLIVLALWLGACVVPSWAQEGGDDPAVPATSVADETCEPGEEEDGQRENGDAGMEADPAAGDCEEELDELTEIELPTGMGAIVEEDPSVRASADDVFEPGEEISEDFPVPLPSDI